MKEMANRSRRIPYNGGKIYRRYNQFTSKKAAQDDAKKLRKRGIKVRVLPSGNYWWTWTHGLTF